MTSERPPRGDNEITNRCENELLDAALSVIRAKGYSATTVDDQAAGVTKGAFFHHFESNEDLAVSAAGHIPLMADRVFSTPPYCAVPDPVNRPSRPTYRGGSNNSIGFPSGSSNWICVPPGPVSI